MGLSEMMNQVAFEMMVISQKSDGVEVDLNYLSKTLWTWRPAAAVR